MTRMFSSVAQVLNFRFWFWLFRHGTGTPLRPKYACPRSPVLVLVVLLVSQYHFTSFTSCSTSCKPMSIYLCLMPAFALASVGLSVLPKDYPFVVLPMRKALRSNTICRHDVKYKDYANLKCLKNGRDNANVFVRSSGSNLSILILIFALASLGLSLRPVGKELRSNKSSRRDM